MATSLQLHPSPICSILLLTVYSLAILIVFLLPMAVLVRIGLVILLVCALAYYLIRHAWLLLPTSYVAIRIEENSAVLITRGGKELSGQVLHDSVVTPVLVVLNVLPHAERRARSVVVFPDSLDRELNRKLRVLLKWGTEVNR